MSNNIPVYIELGALFDERRGILTKMLAQHKPSLVDQWDNIFKRAYDKRIIDLFERKEINITKETFKKEFEKRNINDFCYYLPSNLASQLFLTLMDFEGLGNKPITIDTVIIDINTFPYQLDDELKEELTTELKKVFKFKNNINFIHRGYQEQIPNFFSKYSYVFKYDFLLSEKMYPFFDSIKDCPIPDVKFMVPNVLLKPNDFTTGDISDIITKTTLALSTHLQIIPVNHRLYDYKESLASNENNK